MVIYMLIASAGPTVQDLKPDDTTVTTTGDGESTQSCAER